MFKSILPSRRIPSGDFSILTPLADDISGKENMPTSHVSAITKGRTSKGFIQTADKKKKLELKKTKDSHFVEPPLVSPEAFDKLLDDLQIPSNLRPKLYALDASVKAAMLKSSHTMVPSPITVDLERPVTPQSKPGLRRVQSSDTLDTPRQPTLAALAAEESRNLGYPPSLSVAPVSAHHSPYMSSPQRKTSGHSRGLSFDGPRIFSKSQVNLAASSSTLDLTNHKLTKEKLKDKGATKNLSPMRFCSLLTGTSSLQLEIEDVKKLRLFLRNESATWSAEFLKLGGYSALLTRLNEILEVEWREEQHDDRILHELLRCFKALSTSAIGCFALRSSCPTPFAQLVSLLYSDKKPGDVATRQLIIELLHLLFELYPPSSLPSSFTNRAGSVSNSPRQPAPWESQVSLAASNLITLPAPHKTLFGFIRSLLLTPAPPKAEAPRAPISPHEFIESLHIPRIYKTYLQELSDLCRDYFWIFCHPNNTIWILAETNDARVEKPRAPGGMTGGVEAEAIQYFTTHVRFINSIAKRVEALNMPKEHEHSAYRFHMDLFLGGFERVILISRKASTTYYPTFHLELARYIDFANRAGFELPYTVARLIGMPPPHYAKNPQPSLTQSGSGQCPPRSQPSTPTRGRPVTSRHPPLLPSPVKVEPLKFA